MREYIEREEVMKTARDGYHSDFGRSIADLTSLKELLEDTPVADVVKVVRCKDCKHYGGITFGNICRRWSAIYSGVKNCTKPDDYCSYGERKDGDKK